MRISDWRADVCSSDLGKGFAKAKPKPNRPGPRRGFKHQREAAERQEAAPQKPAAKTAVRARTAAGKRAEERRVGKDCVSTGRSRRSPYPPTNKSCSPKHHTT